MRVFKGIVTGGYGVAAKNLDPLMSLIEARTGLVNLARGTLNVNIPEEYIVKALIMRPVMGQRNFRETLGLSDGSVVEGRSRSGFISQSPTIHHPLTSGQQLIVQRLRLG